MPIQSNGKERKSSASTKPPARSGTVLVSRIRSVGNSKGVILSNGIIKAAGLDPNGEIRIEAGEGVITIAQALNGVNTNLDSWDAQFKRAIRNGAKPEGDLFEGLANDFDEKEW